MTRTGGRLQQRSLRCAMTIRLMHHPSESALHPRYQRRVALAAISPAGGGPRSRHLPRANLAVPTITLGAQVQGRLAVIRHARSQSDAARGYLRLREPVAFYQAIPRGDYTAAAIEHVEALRRQGVRIGTQDL